MKPQMQTEVKERPILFSGPMIQATRDDRKTQTRRVISTVPEGVTDVTHNNAKDIWFWWDGRLAGEVINRYGKPGDRLRVKETFYAYGKYRFTGKKTESGKPEVEFVDRTPSLGREYQYAADVTLSKPASRYEMGWHKRPSIFMPIIASRITLEITNVRVERLTQIDWDGILAEGISDAFLDEYDRRERTLNGWVKLQEKFIELWNSINGKKHPWASNPWVWVVTFKRI